MEQLIRYIERFSQLDEITIEALSGKIEFEKFNKNEFLLKEGNYCSKLYFINRGMLRQFYVDDGKEVTKWLFGPDEMVTSMQSYFKQTPSTEYIEACEDTEVVSISYEKSLELNNFAAMEKFSRLLLQHQLSQIDLLSKKFSNLNAEGKYHMLFEISPEVFRAAKLSHVASIMGVSQETLSRIRAKRT